MLETRAVSDQGKYVRTHLPLDEYLSVHAGDNGILEKGCQQFSSLESDVVEEISLHNWISLSTYG